MKWLHILKLDQCFGEGELVWFLRVKKEKKYTGSPSVVALSMAPTEGNSPYSNSLKDEGYERFKCTDTRGRKGQKREAGEGWRGPIPCLIESPFRTASTSLKNKGRKKTGRLLFIFHHEAQKAQGVYLFYHKHWAPERISEGGGRQFCNLW